MVFVVSRSHTNKYNQLQTLAPCSQTICSHIMLPVWLSMTEFLIVMVPISHLLCIPLLSYGYLTPQEPFPFSTKYFLISFFFANDCSVPLLRCGSSTMYHTHTVSLQSQWPGLELPLLITSVNSQTDLIRLWTHWSSWKFYLILWMSISFFEIFEAPYYSIN